MLHISQDSGISLPPQVLLNTTGSDHHGAHHRGTQAGHQQVPCMGARGALSTASLMSPAPGSELQPRSPKPGAASAPSHHQLWLLSYRVWMSKCT